MIAILIFGLGMIAMGLLISYVHHNEISNAESYSGEIIGFRDKIKTSGYVMYKVYCPVVEYKSGDKVIIADYHSYERREVFRHDVGETVIICANPKAPKSFYFADEEQRFSLLGVSLSAGGILLSIAGIVLMILF